MLYDCTSVADGADDYNVSEERLPVADSAAAAANTITPATSRASRSSPSSTSSATSRHTDFRGPDHNEDVVNVEPLQLSQHYINTSSAYKQLVLPHYLIPSHDTMGVNCGGRGDVSQIFYPGVCPLVRPLSV